MSKFVSKFRKHRDYEGDFGEKYDEHEQERKRAKPRDVYRQSKAFDDLDQVWQEPERKRK